MQKPPVSMPDRIEWNGIDSNDVYLPVRVSGQFLHDKETLVQAMTRYGSGYWLLTPLETENGSQVLINRGFVTPELKEPDKRQAGQIEGTVEVAGLLRLSEPQGRFLQSNKPMENRWYSRDVSAIGQAQGLGAETLAPFFIDANDAENPGGWPMGGLTVVKFRNTHLVYALTWYSLAILTLIGGWIVFSKQSDDFS